MSQLQIYKASAGSGKTHILTQKYLLFAFTSPENFSKVLAVTFTNKAASEMKQRILEELNTIIDSPEKSDQLSTIQRFIKEKDTTKVQKYALQIRTNILHNYTKFSVGTIDSFVQKIVRAFSFEIGVQTGYKIQLDQQKVVVDLIDLLLKSLSENPDLLAWLVKFVDYKIEDGKKINLKEDLQDLVSELFKEKYQKLPVTSMNSTERERIVNFYETLISIKQQFEQTLKQTSKQAKIIIQDHPIPGKLPGNYKIICNFIENKIINFSKVDDLLPNDTVNKMVDNPQNWYAKKAEKDITLAVDVVYSLLNPLISETINFINENFGKYLTIKNLMQNFHSFGILNDVAALLPSYREDNNLLLISDTTKLLKEIIAENDAPFVYEKVGNRFKHILIDEFQDTSGFQWENFKPLIKNSLSEGNDCLIVGDVKQSIYRWRGGDWNLLLNQVNDDIGAAQINEQTLDVNWRSRKNIIDFNNAVFQYSASSLQVDFNQELDQVLDQKYKQELLAKDFDKILFKAYSDSFQQVPNKYGKIGGRVNIKFVKVANARDSMKAWRENMNIDLAKTVDRLLTIDGYKPSDIALLARTNIDAKWIVTNLLGYQQTNLESAQYSIISSDALLISSSPVIRMLESALKYVHNPDDHINLTNLVHEFSNFKGEDEDLHSIFTAFKDAQKLRDFLPYKFLENISILQKTPLYDLVENLISIFEFNLMRKETPYIRTLLDEVYNFQKNNSSDLHVFLEWWEENRSKLSIKITDDSDAVTVMTIHKAKGLAFKVVIIPFCDWKFYHSPTNSPLLWAKTRTEPFTQFEYLPIKYSKSLINTEFAADYFEEKLYSVMDALNTLYVAFTRPREELYVFAPAFDESGSDNVGNLLYSIVNNGSASFLESQPIINISEHFDKSSEIFELKINHLKPEEINPKQQTNYEFAFLPQNKWKDKLSIMQKSKDFFIQSVQSVENKVNYGMFMHEILAKIKTKNDIDDVLKTMVFEGKITKPEYDELLLKLLEIVECELAKDWFSDYWQVTTERAILTKDGNIRIPDRILINEHKILVIDFKFGEFHDEYITQIREYMEIISEIEKRKVEGIIYFPDKEEIITVIV